MGGTRSPWDVPDDPKGVVENRGPVDAEEGRRREPTLERDGYTVRSRRPDCARPGEIMSNERAAQREAFDDEYGRVRPSHYDTEE